ncbi:DOMON-like domain-containing protein [Kaarinaea lacus]
MTNIDFTLQPFDNINTHNLPISINATISAHDNKINVLFRITGEINTILIPEKSGHPSRKNELWTTTCCELFIGGTGQTRYWEYNLSPSHDWAIFSFTNYRTNKTDDFSIPEPGISTKIDKDREFELNTIVALPGSLIGHKLDIGISSIIQDKAGDIYYYALSHPGEQPDFHDRNCFTIHINTVQEN